MNGINMGHAYVIIKCSGHLIQQHSDNWEGQQTRRGSRLNLATPMPLLDSVIPVRHPGPTKTVVHVLFSLGHMEVHVVNENGCVRV